jgi:hypothetical protein
MTDTKPSADWITDCTRERHKVLTGQFAHWCPDWDYLPVDETTPEWECCTCYPKESAP